VPREVTEFRIVVASPADLYETRKVIFNVIDELNRIFEIQKVSIRGLGWEEYVTPGIDTDVQTVISKQILNKYDILLALFATKLGTPTSNSASGTVEEIEHAIANIESPMGSHRVQVYFLDKIDGISGLSLDELRKVFEYRDTLGSRGVLYRTFKNNDELQREIRVNIERPILQYLESRSSVQPSATSNEIKSGPAYGSQSREDVINSVVEEGGFLDHLEIAEEALNASVSSLNQISSLMAEITAETDKQTAEIERLSWPSMPAKERKVIANNFASFLKSKAVNLRQEAEIARGNFAKYTGAFIVAANIEREQVDEERYKEEIYAFLKAAEEMLLQIPQSRISISGFKSAVSNLPRITIQFNQAKRLLLEAIDECLQLFDETERNIYEITAKT
jgi:hypothetical protein